MSGPKSFGFPRISYPISTSSISFTASPRLLGRYSAGPGAGEEIGLGAFSIAGGTLVVPATSQFQLLGRKTAGAGDMEVSTRTEMSIPGLELSNTFTAQQIIDFAGVGFILSRSDATAQGANMQGRKSRGTSGVPTVVLLNDLATQYQALGYDGAGYAVAGNLRWTFIAAVPGPGAMNTRCTIQVSPGTGQTDALSVDTTNGMNVLGNNVFYSNSVMRRRAFTFATLPAAATFPDAFAVITDGAAAPVWNAAAAGGGAVRTPVWSTGAAWQNG